MSKAPYVAGWLALALGFCSQCGGEGPCNESDLVKCGYSYTVSGCPDMGATSDGGVLLTASEYEERRCELLAVCTPGCSKPRAVANEFNSSMAASCLEALQAMATADRCQNFLPAACDRDYASTCWSTVGGACRQEGDCPISPQGWVDCMESDPTNDAHICQLRVPGKAGDGPCDGSATWPAIVPLAVFDCYATPNLACDSTTNKCVPR